MTSRQIFTAPIFGILVSLLSLMVFAASIGFTSHYIILVIIFTVIVSFTKSKWSEVELSDIFRVLLYLTPSLLTFFLVLYFHFHGFQSYEALITVFISLWAGGHIRNTLDFTISQAPDDPLPPRRH